MKKRKRYTVRWSKEARKWTLKHDKDALEFVTKARAVSYGRACARAHTPSQLVLFKKNNQIQTEHTYGQDPRKTKG